MKKIYSLIVAVFFIIFINVTEAHQLSTSYLNGRFDNTGVFTGDWQIRLYDIEQAIGVDTDGDGNLRWQELQSRTEAVSRYLQSSLQFIRANTPCNLILETNWKIDNHFNEGYVSVPVRAQCSITGDIEVHYNGFFEIDSQHKLLVNLSDQKDISPRILSDSNRTLSIAAQTGSRLAAFKEFTYQGAVHIWMGYDHILFLISLLLTCVLIRDKNQWAANKNWREIIVNTTWIVTAFTFAHSITLTATALQWIQLSSRWVEVSIALTVALAALNNIFPLVLRVGWLTFGFGLLHGMGFAGALGELGLPADQQLLTILAFNLGVEIGQLAIVLAVLPLLMFARYYIWYINISTKALSAIIVLVSMQWIWQRI
jgi:hypothetical protein